MTIREILKSKPNAIISSISPNCSIAEAIRHMCEHNIGALLVRDRAGQPIGIVAERDIIRAANGDMAGLAGLTVADVMSRDLIVGLPDDNINYVMQVMTQNRTRHLPIVENDRVVGLISIGDVIKSQLEVTQVQNRKLQDYLHLKGEI